MPIADWLPYPPPWYINIGFELRAPSNQHQFENSNETEQLYLECLIPSMKTSGPNGTSSVFASEGFVTAFRNFYKYIKMLLYLFLKC